MAQILYDDIANHLEEIWSSRGLHDHGIYELINPTTLERTYKAELFPEHGEPLTEQNMPPWVEVSFVWGPVHQQADQPSVPIPLELTWNYTIPISRADKRSDLELVRDFYHAFGRSLATVYADVVGEDELAVEVRRIYLGREGHEPQQLILYASGTSDIGDVLLNPSTETLRNTLRDEFIVATALIRHCAERFSPGTVGGYRSVESA